MASLFTKIINGEIPCHKVAENERCFAFLDIFPVTKGHVIVVPKMEEDKFYELEDETYRHLMSFSKTLAKAIEKSMPCSRVGMSIIGLEVPHAHIHLVPLNQMSDINFSKPKLSLAEDELSEIASKIQSAL